MRRMISQKLISWIKSLKEILIHNTTTNTTELGGNVEIDGDLKLEGISAIKDKDGHPIGKDLEDAVNGENTVEITFTEDDWDEEQQAYVKHIEVNNSFIFIQPIQNPTHEKIYKIFNPFFKGINARGLSFINSFGGLENIPEERYLDFSIMYRKLMSVFNGVLETLDYDI